MVAGSSKADGAVDNEGGDDDEESHLEERHETAGTSITQGRHAYTC